MPMPGRTAVGSLMGSTSGLACLRRAHAPASIARTAERLRMSTAHDNAVRAFLA
jgi:hypothetical protein